MATARWTALSLCVLVWAAATAPAQVTAIEKTWNPDCITEPVGFGRGTTGGAGGSVVTPKNNDELMSALCSKRGAKGVCIDAEPRVILLDRTFQFRGNQVIQRGCWQNSCSTGARFKSQMLLNKTSHCLAKKLTNVRFDEIGLNPLVVGSNKTLMGVDGKGAILGRGLGMRKVSNIIVRDLTLSDVNPQVVFGGDAITMKDTSKIWIHKVVFKDYGRMFLSTERGTNTGVTVSSCEFNGNTNYSASCDGRHYWLWMFWGRHDEVTLINNFIHHTSGRGPHAGGFDGSETRIHLVGNYFLQIGEGKHSGWAVEPNLGSSLLVEGNLWASVSQPVRSGQGRVFFPLNADDAKACSVITGSPCLPNVLKGSGDIDKKWRGASALSAFKNLTAGIAHARKAVCLSSIIKSSGK